MDVSAPRGVRHAGSKKLGTRDQNCLAGATLGVSEFSKGTKMVLLRPVPMQDGLPETQAALHGQDQSARRLRPR
jgi:hypothetical protein